MAYDLLKGAQEQSSKAVFLLLEIGQLFAWVVGGVGVPPRSLLQTAASRPIEAPFCRRLHSILRVVRLEE